MKKQITYPNIITRIISSMIDIIVVFFIFHTLDNLFHIEIYMYKYVNSIDFIGNEKMISFKKLLVFQGITTLINIVMLFCYMVYFWYRYGTTAGKFITKTKVVDYTTGKKPKLSQLIIRFMCYPLGLFTIAFIIFSKNRRAIHDRLSHTIVINI